MWDIQPTWSNISNIWYSQWSRKLFLECRTKCQLGRHFQPLSDISPSCWLANISGNSCFHCQTFYVYWTLMDKMSGKVWALCRTSEVWQWKQDYKSIVAICRIVCKQYYLSFHLTIIWGRTDAVTYVCTISIPRKMLWSTFSGMVRW